MVPKRFHVKNPPKWYVIWPPDPPSETILFQWPPQAAKDLSEKQHTDVTFETFTGSWAFIKNVVVFPDADGRVMENVWKITEKTTLEEKGTVICIRMEMAFALNHTWKCWNIPWKRLDNSY